MTNTASSIVSKWRKTVRDAKEHEEVFQRVRSLGPHTSDAARKEWAVRIAEWDDMYEKADIDRDETGKSNDVFGLDKNQGRCSAPSSPSLALTVPCSSNSCGNSSQAG
jgi:hypothetical protein